MKAKLHKIDNQLPIRTIKNSIASIILALSIIIFNLARTTLTSMSFGVDSLGLLTIVIGILPYMSSGHNSLFSVGTAKLYNSIHLRKFNDANKEISNIKHQFYLFGIFYLLLTIIIAFAFPFIVGKNGGTIYLETDILNNYENKIEWWESSLFIISNSIELISTYMLVPITMILLFIHSKSYIYNNYNILLTFLLNGLIILLFILKINNIIDINFVYMNIIIIVTLGIKTLLIRLILIPYKKKYYRWIKKVKNSSKKISKEYLQSVATTYLDQFSTDAIAILFMLYASFQTADVHAHNHTIEANLQHAGHGSTTTDSNFIPSAIYMVFLTLLTSANEVVHSIVDAAIPTMAEHMTHNQKKINKHFFHRFQMLSVFIASFTCTTYILTSSLFHGVMLNGFEAQHHDHHLLYLTSNQLNILVTLLWLPLFVEIFSSMYRHILVMFGEFKKNMNISLIKTISLLIPLVITAAIIFTCVDEHDWTIAIFSTLISCSLFANLIGYIIARKVTLTKLVSNDNCVNILKSTILSFSWLLCTIAIMLPITITHGTAIINLIYNQNVWIIIGVAIVILAANFYINWLCIYLFRKDDFLYYVNETRNYLKLGKKASK